MSEPRERERDLEGLLSEWQAPGESQAEERAWRLAAEDFARREPTRRRLPVRAALVGGIGALLATLILTPAGARVGDLVRDAVGANDSTPEITLGGLPPVGPLLVRASSGMWIVQPDGSREHLGSYEDAAWSPHGRFIAATSPGSLDVVEPDGDERWSIEARRPTSPVWSESGFRIAYLRGGTVRVVAGDGSGDERIAEAARVAPAWRPPPLDALRGSVDGVGTHDLTYADHNNRIHLVDTDSGIELWDARLGGMTVGPDGVEELSWSADGSRLLVTYQRGYAVLRRNGTAVYGVPASRVGAAAISPDGEKVATVEPYGPADSADRSRRVLVRPSEPGGQPVERVLSGPGPIGWLEWAPDGRWLAIGWRGANNWIFVRPAGKTVGVGEITQDFNSDRSSFPRIADWCCRAR